MLSGFTIWKPEGGKGRASERMSRTMFLFLDIMNHLLREQEVAQSDSKSNSLSDTHTQRITWLSWWKLVRAVIKRGWRWEIWMLLMDFCLLCCFSRNTVSTKLVNLLMNSSSSVHRDSSVLYDFWWQIMAQSFIILEVYWMDGVLFLQNLFPQLVFLRWW